MMEFPSEEVGMEEKKSFPDLSEEIYDALVAAIKPFEHVGEGIIAWHLSNLLCAICENMSDEELDKYGLVRP